MENKIHKNKREYLNKFINKNLSIDSISNEDKNIIDKIPKIDFTYICKYCQQIPKIVIDYNKDENFIEKLYFKECGMNSNFINEVKEYNCDLNLTKIEINSLKNSNYMKIKKHTQINNNYLNFESLGHFNKYINVYKSYLI